MSPLYFAIAVIPLGIYFMMLGAIRLRRHPLITTGWRDTLTLGVAASGFVAIGPMQLFFPSQAATRWHAWVWLALFILYLLGLMMILLSAKPRLIAYGMEENQFHRTLLEAARQVDPQAQWTGEVVSMPHSGLQLAREATGATRVQQVVHVGLLHNIQDWLKLENAFVVLASKTQCAPSLAGWPFLVVGLLLLVAAITPMLSDPAATLAQLKTFLNR